MNLRERVEDQLDLDEADVVWLSLLDTACAAEKTINDLELIIASDGMLSTGSTGQTIVHPCVAELRQQRAAFAKLLQALGLDEVQTQIQRQARNVQKRWNK